MMIGAALLRYGDASNFEISDSLLRPTPSSNQVLVNIHSSSVNPIDLMKREGYGKTIFEKQRPSNFPWILGSDFSGTVSEVGSKITKFKNVKGIVFSGGPSTVTKKKFPSIPKKIFLEKIPILGICYGLQLIVKLFNGSIKSLKTKK